MSYLDDLRRSLSEVSEDELHNMILALRQERRAAPSKSRTKKSVRKPVKKSTVDINDLTRSQQLELLKLLGGQEHEFNQ